MDPVVLAAIIGFLGIVAGALLQVFGQAIVDAVRRQAHGIPDITGQWKGAWFIDEGGKQVIYVEDSVDIVKVRGFKVEGIGKDTKGTYKIEGNLSIHGILTIQYLYKHLGLSGIAILQVDPLAKRLEGIWYGYLKEKSINGGRVVWEKLS